MPKKVLVIGAGFAGLSAASFMAKEGWQVTVVEKHGMPGGRARRLQEAGFSFDMGPSWYWMPDVFERYFKQFGKNVSDYYKLHRLDPSYRVYWPEGASDIPANYQQLKKLFDSIEPGAGGRLDKFLKEAEYKYSVGMQKLVHKPALSITEFMDWEVISGIFRLDIFSSIKHHIGRYFKHPRLRQLLEFPVLFLGALPENTPALYSLMNYADIVGGTWYPEGGMYSVVQGMHKLAEELGVQFRFNETVQQIVTDKHAVRKVVTDKGAYTADAVIGGADYHFIETNLLQPADRSYSQEYWNKKLMAPSCLLYYVGINKKLRNACHHMLFFDVPFEQHAQEIYSRPAWPSNPLFYVSVSSVTDDTAAPEGQENLVFLVPVAAGLEGDTEALRDAYFQRIMARFEQRMGEPVGNAIVYKKTFAYTDFLNEYNSFKGNAYGLANTLLQTAIFRPSCRSKKIRNLFYAGQLTVPGPGVPPSLISGEVAAREAVKNIKL